VQDNVHAGFFTDVTNDAAHIYLSILSAKQALI
jgi:hypothetical protein